MQFVKKISIAVFAGAAATLFAAPAAHAGGLIDVGIPVLVSNEDGLANGAGIANGAVIAEGAGAVNSLVGSNGGLLTNSHGAANNGLVNNGG